MSKDKKYCPEIIISSKVRELILDMRYLRQQIEVLKGDISEIQREIGENLPQMDFLILQELFVDFDLRRK